MIVCSSCRIRIGERPTYGQGRAYCCNGCAAGGPCTCTYEDDLGRYPPSPYGRPVSLAEIFDRYDGATPPELAVDTSAEADGISQPG